MPSVIEGKVLNTALVKDEAVPHLIGATPVDWKPDALEIILQGNGRYTSIANPAIRKNGALGDLLDMIGAERVKLTLGDDGKITDIDIYE